METQNLIYKQPLCEVIELQTQEVIAVSTEPYENGEFTW